MKKNILTFVYLILLCPLFGIDYSFFKYNDDSACDYFTGINYFSTSYFDNIQNKDKIDYTEDIVNKDNDHGIRKTYYNEQGLVIKIFSDIHETNIITYDYNEKNYLESINTGMFFKYVYQSENQRDLYYGDKFQYRQTIKNEGDTYTVLTERINPKSNLLTVDERCVYIYDENRIKKYESTTMDYIGNIYNVTTFDFNYDLEKRLHTYIIKGINMHTGTKTWNTIVSFEYDISGNLYKIINNDLKRPEESTVTEFGNYDKYGNWQNRKIFRSGKLCDETVRKIQYK